jgi:hypothetical protein
MTGSAPSPVPTTKRRHFHGISSSSESGVCPKASRNFLEAFFFLITNLASVDHHIIAVFNAIDPNLPK